MTKENFNWKSIFVNDENASTPKEEIKTQVTLNTTDNKSPNIPYRRV